jgi:hypothetical protein
VDESRQRDDGDVAPFTQDGGRADLHGLGSLGDLLPAEVQRLVLDEHHRVRVTDRSREQACRVDGAARHHDLEAGHVDEPALEALRVLRRPTLSGAALRPQDERHGQLAA